MSRTTLLGKLRAFVADEDGQDVIEYGMLIATILGVLLIPMLYVMVEKVVGGAKKQAPAPVGAPPPALAAHSGGSH